MVSGNDENVTDIDWMLVQEGNGMRVFIDDKSIRDSFSDRAKHTLLITHDYLYTLRNTIAI
jgi:hypothetical protein